MSFTLLVVSLAVSLPVDDEWKVPETPNPTSILQSANKDTQNGDLERALAKHLWYHENALKFDPAQAGVRLSFALGYWHDLGRIYAPAMKKLKQVRDSASKEILAGENSLMAFHEFASINNELNEQKKTVQLFKKLDKEKPDLAKAVASVAIGSLIKADEYKLIARHLDFRQEAKRLNQTYIQLKASMPDLSLSFLDDQALALLKILVKTDQQELAQELGEEFKEANDDGKFHKKVDKLVGPSSEI